MALLDTNSLHLTVPAPTLEKGGGRR